MYLLGLTVTTGKLKAETQFGLGENNLEGRMRLIRFQIRNTILFITPISFKGNTAILICVHVNYRKA
jgi:hypothetical protein